MFRLGDAQELVSEGFFVLIFAFFIEKLSTQDAITSDVVLYLFNKYMCMYMCVHMYTFLYIAI